MKTFDCRLVPNTHKVPTTDAYLRQTAKDLINITKQRAGGSLPNFYHLFSHHERIYGNRTNLAPCYSSSYINRYERHKARTRNEGDHNIAVRNNSIRHNFRSFPDTRYVSKHTIKLLLKLLLKQLQRLNKSQRKKRVWSKKRVANLTQH